MRSLVLVAVLSAGCNLYWGHHGGDDICPVSNGADQAPALELRNPEDGVCQPFGFGGGCDNSCGPCATEGVQLPNWPACAGTCEGLDESTCLSTATCHAAYLTAPEGAPPPDQAPTFWQCWETSAPGGIPAKTTGACNTLDVDTCVFRDDCIGIYDATPSPSFQACAPEPVNMSCDLTTCATDTHCEQQCTDDTCRAYCVPNDLCAAVTCTVGSTCVETCDPTTGTCQASCVAATACAALATEATCQSRTDCEPVYKGDDCTCLPDGCTCAIETYERCQTR